MRRQVQQVFRSRRSGRHVDAAGGRLLSTGACTTVWLAVLGGLLGVVAKAADESTVQWLGDFGTQAGAWLFAAALIGRLAATRRVAATRSALLFLGVCSGYYGWGHYVLGFPTPRILYLWVLFALTAAPAMSAAVSWASRRRGVLAGMVMAAAAGSVFVDGAARQVSEQREKNPPEYQIRSAARRTIQAMGAVKASAHTRVWRCIGITPPMTPAIASVGTACTGRTGNSGGTAPNICSL